MEELLEGLKTFDPGVPDPSEFINFVPNSDWQKQLARKNALKRNENYKGGNNPRAKTWRIVYNDGREIIIKALQRWAVDNGYSRAGIKNIAYGKWKTYKDLVTVEEVAQ
jgi:hypothetical protein